jgi:hypothetical protein
MFDSELMYSALIVVSVELKGEEEELCRIPFWSGFHNESDEYKAFLEAIESTAAALADAYSHWPDGYVSVQTRINRTYCNV